MGRASPAPVVRHAGGPARARSPTRPRPPRGRSQGVGDGAAFTNGARLRPTAAAPLSPSGAGTEKRDDRAMPSSLRPGDRDGTGVRVGLGKLVDQLVQT